VLIICSLLYVAFVAMFRQVTQTLQKDLLYMDSSACLLAEDVTLHLPLQMDSASSDTFRQQQNVWAFCKIIFYDSIITKTLSSFQHSAMCILTAASKTNKLQSVCHKPWFSYLPGSGGLGGGPASFSIDSELCECDSDPRPWLSNTDEDVCSKICRSRGVRGMSGRELRWGRSAP